MAVRHVGKPAVAIANFALTPCLFYHIFRLVESRAEKGVTVLRSARCGADFVAVAGRRRCVVRGMGVALVPSRTRTISQQQRSVRTRDERHDGKETAMHLKFAAWTVALASLAILAACGTTGNDGRNYGTPATASGTQYENYTCDDCGVVSAIQQVNASGNGSTVLGTVGGAVVGGLLGHQVGSGRGNTAATVAGAAGGAYAGHELQKRHNENQAADGAGYRITVHMYNGSDQAVTQATEPDVRVGDAVRVVNGQVERR
jgi:outer membrane lipoprotein SlyB